jgi:multisubunit Na+/H+ antiporter MnhE subunit
MLAIFIIMIYLFIKNSAESSSRIGGVIVNVLASNVVDRGVNFQGDDHGDVEIRFVLDQHAWWDFYSASSLK